MKKNNQTSTGYIIVNLNTPSERNDSYLECERHRKPYVAITEGRKFSRIMYDTAPGMESARARDHIVVQLRELARVSGWEKRCGLACSDTLVGSVTGVIFRVPNDSSVAVANIINDAFLAT